MQRSSRRRRRRRPALLLLHFGTYAVLCQLTGILLLVCLSPDTVSTEVLRHTVTPYLEYPLMSLALILGGSLLLDWVTT